MLPTNKKNDAVALLNNYLVDPGFEALKSIP